jgi:beta-galactosidase
MDTEPALRLPHLIYGGDYNPEQWPEATWLEDARLMREAGVNLVSLGIFAWSKLEPAPGVYDFAWLDRLMDLLHDHGVSVNLATPTASPPPWLLRRYPDALPVTEDGVKLWHGSRRHYCPHNPGYHEHVRALVTRLAERYRGHPALALWHVDNEYAGHIGACFCDNSTAAFQQWLQARYGTLDGLNEAWGTAFWSQRYGAWEEIHPPRRAPTFINPSQQLDWARFCNDSWLACYEEQRDILREITPDVPVTTNFMGFHKSLDYWQWAPRLDVIANDNYPDTSDPNWMVEAGMICDLMRSLGGRRPWVLMEQSTTHVNWRPVNPTKRPGVMRLCSYQSIARGADGIMFFQWRASKAGAEKFHSAMLPHAGTDSRVWREVKALGQELPRLDALLNSQVQAEVAILFDWQSWWALELDGKPSSDVRLMPQVLAYYSALFSRGITVDFVHPEADLSRYHLLIAPNLYLVNDQAARNVVQAVADGAVLVMSFFSGMVDANEHMRLGYYPAPFQEMLGLQVEEYDPYARTQVNAFRTDDGQVFGCTLRSDIIRLQGAQSIACYLHDFYADSPAVTRHAFDKGLAFYVGTAPNRDGLAWLVQRACQAAGVQAVAEVPSGIELVSRRNGRREWLFVLNHCSQAQDVPLDRAGIDLLTGAAVNGSVRLEPTGVAIVEVQA